VLRQLARLLAARVDPELLFQAMAEGLRELLIADRASLAIYVPERDEFEIVALALHEGSRLGKGWTIPHRGSQVGHVFDSGRPFIKVHGSGLVLYEDRPLFEEGMQSAAVVPLVADGERIGTLNTDTRDVHERTTEEIECLVEVASHIAGAVASFGTLGSFADGAAYARRRAGASLPDRASDILAECPSLRGQLARLVTMAATDATVLVTGETGTGKGLVARALHELGRRSAGPFVKCDCAALAPTLVETELFGHERGAFTGAQGRRVGCFERAHGGTLFLDEVGELPLELQAKLLGVLQDRQLVRVGGASPVDVDVRVVAATNRDLHADVRAGRFRRDLLYRLDVLRFDLAPLRERRADIGPLAEYFVRKCSARIGCRPRPIPPAALETFARYPWPGNVRELENVIERWVVLGDAADIAAARDTHTHTLGAAAALAAPDGDAGLLPLAELERRHITRVLQDDARADRRTARRGGDPRAACEYASQPDGAPRHPPRGRALNVRS
jgi:transcriptional regulator with GAF, ATPase, and Fis domain